MRREHLAPVEYHVFPRCPLPLDELDHSRRILRWNAERCELVIDPAVAKLLGLRASGQRQEPRFEPLDTDGARHCDPSVGGLELGEGRFDLALALVPLGCVSVA